MFERDGMEIEMEMDSLQAKPALPPFYMATPSLPRNCKHKIVTVKEIMKGYVIEIVFLK
jgi:hypothetical protein